MASSSVPTYGSVSYDSYEEVAGFQADADAQTQIYKKAEAKRTNYWVAGMALVATTIAIGVMVTFNQGSLASLQTYMEETISGEAHSAKVTGTSRAAHSAFPSLPTLGDSDSMHTWIKENYLLYSSWIIQAGNMEAPIPTDMPDREPEGNMGTRERDYAPIKQGGYVIFASFSDPDCKEYLGYMAVQLNKCVASWLGSDAVTGVQTYYSVRTTVSESMITTTTQMFSDAQCTHAATPTVNMTNNMACNAWGSHDKVFSKFSFAKAVPEMGAGAMFAGYGDAGCSTGVQEALYVDVADGTKCSGGLKGICDGTTKATLVHYIDVDYECNNHAVAEGYPMTVSSSCAWDNSYGLSAYGKSICGTPSEGYMAVPGVAPQLGGAYVIPDLEVWKPEEAANGEPMESPVPEVKEEIIVAPVAPEDEEQLASQQEASTAQGGPMSQKNGPPPGSVKTA